MTELPTGWTTTSLGEVAEWTSGGTPKAGTPVYYGGGVPWAVIGDLKDGLVTTTTASITDAGLANSSAKVVPAGTVLVAMYGSIGKLGIAGVDMATNQAIACARPLEVVTRDWLFWWLRYQRNDLLAAGKGGTQANISQTVLKAWPIPIAPQPEQVRIVAAIEEAFSLLDAGETALHNTRTRLKRMRDSVLTGAVNGQLVPQDPTDPPADKSLADLGIVPVGMSDAACEIPKSWAWCRVSDLLSTPLANGRSVPTRDDGFPVLRLTCLKDGGIDLRERKGGDWTAAGAAPFLVATGDFLVSRGNGSLNLVGRGGLIRATPDPVAFPDTLIRVRVNAAAVSPELLETWWRTGLVRRHIESSARTTAGIYKINQGVIEDLLLPVPPHAEQARIVAEVGRQLSFIEAAERAVDAGLARSAGLRRSVLKAAFEGRLVEQDPADEPASVLLARIAAERAATAPGKRVPRGPRGKVVAS